MRWILTKRAFKAVMHSWMSLIIAGLLLYFADIRWFYLYCFVEWIASSAAWNDTHRCVCRMYQIGNECKLFAIMEHLGVTVEDAGRMFEKHIKDTLDAKASKELDKDATVAFSS